MKKLFTLVLFATTLAAAMAQQAVVNQFRQKPMKRSSTLGWILVAGGAATALGGIAVSSSDKSFVPNETIGTIMIAGGGAAIITGVILLSSGNNKKQTSKDSWEFDLEMEKTVVPDMYGYAPIWKIYQYPVISFKLQL